MFICWAAMPHPLIFTWWSSWYSNTSSCIQSSSKYQASLAFKLHFAWFIWIKVEVSCGSQPVLSTEQDLLEDLSLQPRPRISRCFIHLEVCCFLIFRDSLRRRHGTSFAEFRLARSQSFLSRRRLDAREVRKRARAGLRIGLGLRGRRSEEAFRLQPQLPRSQF